MSVLAFLKEAPVVRPFNNHTTDTATSVKLDDKFFPLDFP
jgi:hypothetical protein